MHSTLPLHCAADWRERSPFSCYAPLDQHTAWWWRGGKQQARLPSQCFEDCGQRSVLRSSISQQPGCLCDSAPMQSCREKRRQSCAAWTSIGSGNWKCVERHLHHRCYLLILVCKGPYYPAVTAATCIRLLTPVCFLLVLPTFISALASALFLVWWSCCFMKSHFLCSD